MKKFLFLILCTFLLTSQSLAAGLVGKTQGMRLVASGTFTAANARVSYVNGTAFVCFDTDISTYAGTDAGSTPYFIQLQDASGDIAQGYCGANGTAETLSGTEKITNPTFDANATGWNAGDCTIASSHPAGGGQSDDYLILTVVSAAQQYIYQSQALTLGALYKISGYVKSGTSGNESYTISIDESTGSFDFAVATGTTSASWVQNSGYGVAPITECRFFMIKNTSTAGTMFFDELSGKQVTDCAVTGLHIMSAKNGTVRNWYSISATFGYNNAMSYRIYRVY